MVRNLTLPRIASIACRLLQAGVWLYAGAAKITDLDGSVHAVKAYQLLPSGVAEVVGAGLPFVEIGLGLLLLAGMATRMAAGVSAVLLAGFVAGITSAWARGLQIDCGCFGGGGDLAAGESPAYTLNLVRDVGLLLAAGFLVWRPRTPWSVDAWLAG